MTGNITTWVAAIGTLALMSFMWKDNKFYSIFEHIYVASGAAHALIMGIKNIRINSIDPLTSGNFIAIVPLVLGLMLYARFIPGQMKWTRYPIAATVGIGLGQNLPRLASSNFVKQIQSSLGKWNFETVLVLVSIICVILYFYFTASKKANAILNYTSRYGRLVMMVAFGALFGNTVMGRLSLMIGRLSFLFRDWLGIVG